MHPLSQTTTFRASDKKLYSIQKGEKNKTNAEEPKQVSEPDSDMRVMLKIIQKFAPMNIHMTF